MIGVLSGLIEEVEASCVIVDTTCMAGTEYYGSGIGLGYKR